MRSLHHPPAMDLRSRGGKSLMVVDTDPPRTRLGGPDTGARGERADGQAQCPSHSCRSQLLSGQCEGVRTLLLQCQSNASPPAVNADNLDSTNNEPTSFSRGCAGLERSLPNLSPSPELPGVSLCLHREQTSFFPSVRKRWSKVFKRQ